MTCQMAGAGLEPARSEASVDFKSTASTGSATPPLGADERTTARGRCQRALLFMVLYPLLAGHADTVPLPTPDPAKESRAVYAYPAHNLSDLQPGRRSKAQAGDFVIGN